MCLVCSGGKAVKYYVSAGVPLPRQLLLREAGVLKAIAEAKPCRRGQRTCCGKATAEAAGGDPDAAQLAGVGFEGDAVADGDRGRDQHEHVGPHDGFMAEVYGLYLALHTRTSRWIS